MTLPDGPPSHLEIESVNPARARLPLIGTGYRSHLLGGCADEAGHVITDMVRAWLDTEADSKAWKDYIQEGRQLTLS